jgi:hypothetical protein
MYITPPTSTDDVKEVTKARKITNLQVHTFCRQRALNVLGMT